MGLIAMGEQGDPCAGKRSEQFKIKVTGFPCGTILPIRIKRRYCGWRLWIDLGTLCHHRHSIKIYNLS
jgi:hypothetical protein